MIDKIIQYECGELDEVDTLKLFSELVQNGMAWKLQGHYGRTASNLIEQGCLSDAGEILVEL